MTFFFVVISWGTHILSFFYLSDFLQMSNNHRMVNDEFFLSTSPEVVRVSDLMIALNWSLSYSIAGQDTPHLQDSWLLCKTSWTTTALISAVCSLSVTRPRALLIMWALSTALWPILYLDDKIAWICFWSYIISLV